MYCFIMEPIAIREALRAISGELVAGAGAGRITSISTDTRSLAPGDFYIALKGTRYDGHVFLGEAAERGAAGLVYAAAVPAEQLGTWAARGMTLIRVRDTLAALQDLARWYRRGFTIPIVAVTGSNGKTTTKEMIRTVASGRFSVLCSEGSFNNHVGVPLTLLRLESVHSLGVVEMGMNARGEIARLAGIAAPDIGVVTNVGPAHLEFLGSVDNVAASKAELLEVMSSAGGAGGVAILNCDDPRVARMGSRTGLRVRTFGTSPDADVRAERVRAERAAVSFSMVFARPGRRVGVTMPVIGMHNVYNALAAAAVCEVLEMEPDEIARSLGELRLPAMRMELLSRDGVVLINDAYNANPDSMRAAVDALAGMSVGGRRILVMGDMLELGAAAGDAHTEIGRIAAERGIDLLIAVGEHSARAAAAAREAGMPEESVVWCPGVHEAAAALAERARPGDCVLLKASRRMGLERIIAKR
jgi:UDP-N-acetylmuramoyl-tripeptide--D-alanyl-D-alanine ligase